MTCKPCLQLYLKCMISVWLVVGAELAPSTGQTPHARLVGHYAASVSSAARAQGDTFQAEIMRQLKEKQARAKRKRDMLSRCQCACLCMDTDC